MYNLCTIILLDDIIHMHLMEEKNMLDDSK